VSASPTAAPPSIPGFVPEESIRSGGFADVFRYRQELTERDVAVKVLKAALTDDGSEQRFVTEANVMARLSTHPYIVTIHLAGVTADGRPYLVMEYCSRDDLAQRVKQETLSIAEVLRIGVRVGGAVETAHRARVLHRDIKPANVLTTDYGNPALTDFGISATVHETAGIEGLSVPWSPPEALLDPAATSVASDVYSLAATIWHLLAGRSPFARPQGPNGVNDLIHRIANTPVPRTGRPDVPPGLERLLGAAMSKEPEDRPASALEFARSLQALENAAGYAETTVDILEAARPRSRRPVVLDDEPGTRVRGVVVIDPDAGPTTARPSAPAVQPVADETLIRAVPGQEDREQPTDRADVTEVSESEGHTRIRLVPGPPPVEDTQVRPRPETPAPAPEPHEQGSPRGRRGWVLAGAAALVVASGVTAAVVAAGAPDGGASAGPTTSAPETPVDAALPDVVPTPAGLTGARQPDGTVVFTWQTPDAADGDTWVVRRADPGADTTPRLLDTPTVTVTDIPAGSQACIEVALRRADARTSATPASACAG
jgi:serine/threonine protein kinase